VISRQVAEGMNQMMQKVVTDGTGQRAALDFTNVVGKTGTSTGPKDAWFVGFTGKYVAGIWLGNDDNRAMRNGVTGGQFAAPLWHDFMTVAHTDMNIRDIPGLPTHPVQIAERQRLAEVAAAQAAAGIAPSASLNPDGTPKPQRIMPGKTRDALKSLAVALRKANGEAEPAAAPVDGAPASPNQKPSEPGKAVAPAEPGKRADRTFGGRPDTTDDLSLPAADTGDQAARSPTEARRRGVN